MVCSGEFPLCAVGGGGGGGGVWVRTGLDRICEAVTDLDERPFDEEIEALLPFLLRVTRPCPPDGTAASEQGARTGAGRRPHAVGLTLSASRRRPHAVGLTPSASRRMLASGRPTAAASSRCARASVCACACVRVRASACGCVCVCVRVCAGLSCLLSALSDRVHDPPQAQLMLERTQPARLGAHGHVPSSGACLRTA